MTSLVVLNDNNTMSKKAKQTVEYRYYEIPQNMPVLAMLGQGWVREYGAGIESLHFHNLYEIGYCYEGTGELVYDGESIPYSANTFTLIPANFPHTTNSTVGTLSRWEYLFIDVDILKNFYGNDPIFAKNLIKLINTKASALTADDQPELSYIILSICNEMRNREDLYIETVNSTLITLFLLIARLNKSDALGISTHTSSNISIISSAIEYIAANCTNEILISDLANICHVSETHFRRIFEKAMNMKPMEYINLTRVQAACEYMKRHDSSMSTVAIKSGFQTTSTMNRNFNKYLGLTPYQWKSHPENYEGKLLNYKITALKGWD